MKSHLFVTLLLIAACTLTRFLDAHSHSHSGGGDHGHAHSHGKAATSATNAKQQQPETKKEPATTHSRGSPNQRGPPSDESACDAKEEEIASVHSRSPGIGRNLASDSLLATAAITLLGNAGIAIFYFSNVSDAVLRLLSAFAVGGLLGDAFLHLIPHALGSEGADSHIDGVWILVGIGSFFALEKLTEALHAGHSHSHSRSQSRDDRNDADDDDLRNKPTTGSSSVGKDGSKQRQSSSSEIALSSSIKPGAVLNLIADATHNFLDGMALVSAFRVSRSLGVRLDSFTWGVI